MIGWDGLRGSSISCASAMSGAETGCATDAASPITGDTITIHDAQAGAGPGRHNRLIRNAFWLGCYRTAQKWRINAS